MALHTEAEALQSSFRTRRIIFRALESNDHDKSFFTEMGNDPITTAMSRRSYIKPQSTDEFDRTVHWAKSCLIFVVACLATVDPALESSANTENETAGSNAAPIVNSGTVAPTPIGFVALFDPSGNLNNAYQHRVAMLGICIAAAHRGKGYGTEMVNWAVDWGFRRGNLHRIHLGVWSYNHNAIELYRKLGFVEEGRDREAVFYDREWHDIICFGLLEHEWERLRSEDLSVSST
ncbi:acyl-CoA N-acyltransferase [Xylariales sp. PMI_506]|nr:acyl-CoA N-acyltransferase [Xylariales sp. PMI_506]